ncbi:unnamed protein product (macronuclear) [Paramecium tetraurelia]|uniref:Uncharacterized protein n=1 Tax=Paramecium tetraurelia TaxID=5888 RepID=A0BE84_PARTE|nr:uncharacterized protein GSPATT00027884001 [Paramecium tetraurelia]CAK56851.1 unnamed protein product [Paramecium tetraurelia]|eukprot:XP_001424249.1 hypothetical protein (macronuclear) [Paramecium tetraurelia strain d4-2]
MTQLKLWLFLKKTSESQFKTSQQMNKLMLEKKPQETNNTKPLLLRLLPLMMLLMPLMKLAKLIQHLSLGASFVQVKSKYETIHKRLTDNTSHSQLLQPVVAALTELATHGVNQKALTKIAQLLSEIRQQLVSEKATKTDVEERQAAHWAEFSAHLSNEHTRLVERKAQLEVQIQEQKDTIEDAQSWIEFHTLELENSEERLAGQQAWYAVQSEIYETQTAEREAQNEIVDRLQEHISEKLSTTAQFISKRN